MTGMGDAHTASPIFLFMTIESSRSVLSIVWKLAVANKYVVREVKM